MIIALWFTWSERNTIREEGRRRSTQMLARCVELYAMENAVINSKTSVRQARQQARWSKPPTETLKINCDTSFLPDCRSGSWGFLIRDSDGDAVLMARGKANHLLDAFHAELIACLQGIQVAVDLGIG